MKKRSSKDNKKVGASVNDWAIALKDIGEDRVADLLYEEPEVKKKGLAVIEKYKLPRLEIVNLPLRDFLAKSEEVFKGINGTKYYVSLRYLKGMKPRVRAIDLKKKEVFCFIEKEVKEEGIENYEILIFNYYENIYGGNIVVSTNNKKVFLELAEGNHGGIVTGETTPTLFAEMALDDKSIKIYQKKKDDYESLGTGELRDAIIKTLAYLPCGGYYEFILTRKKKAETLSPIFIDYRSDEKYQIHDWL